MIEKIKRFFEEHISINETTSDAEIEHQLQLACAALMLEVLNADYSIKQDELDALRAVLQQAFDLDTTEADQLIELAKEERAEATDYYQFTSLINEFYTQQQKRKLITRLWQMAYADQKVHKFEEHLIRRLAHLLHVPHSAFIHSKHRASKKPRN